MATRPDELQGTRTSRTGSTTPSPGMPGTPVAPSPGAAAAVAREPDPYANLVDNYTHFSTLHSGDIRQGRVLKVSGEEVIVDIGYKCEGLAPIEQFRDPWGRIRVEPNDVVDVMVEHAAEVDEIGRAHV